MKDKFMVTADSNTADILRKIGFKEIETGNKNNYTFLNDATLKFSECVDMSKIRYSNILTF